MFRTRWIRNLLAFPKSQGQRRLRAAQAHWPIRRILDRHRRHRPLDHPTTIP